MTAVEGGSELFEGSGNGEVDIVRFDDDGDPNPEADGPVLVRVTSDGNELSYIGVEADGVKVVDTIGAFDGISVVTDSDVAALEITTLDSWTVQFVPMSNAKKFEADTDNDDALTATGEQPTVLQVPADTTSFSITFETSEVFSEARPFRVLHVAENGETEAVFERVGTTADGRFDISGPGHLVVADIGTWTITQH